MIRIIGGTARGRRLKTPAGESTRPTSDRVREALFSSLEAELGSLTGLRFLDLYAGSGAIGFEAMSRGAGVVTSVESNRRTARLVVENAATLGFDKVEVLTQPVARVLAHRPRAPYDVVFVDPPYPVDNDEVERAVALPGRQRLARGGRRARRGALGAQRGTDLARGAGARAREGVRRDRALVRSRRSQQRARVSRDDAGR